MQQQIFFLQLKHRGISEVRHMQPPDQQEQVPSYNMMKIKRLGFN